MRIDVLNGVNLSMLGRRDPAVYGDQSIQDLETQIYAWARELDLQVRCRQTDHEGEYVGFLHQALGQVADDVTLGLYERDALDEARRLGVAKIGEQRRFAAGLHEDCRVRALEPGEVADVDAVGDEQRLGEIGGEACETAHARCSPSSRSASR